MCDRFYFILTDLNGAQSNGAQSIGEIDIFIISLHCRIYKEVSDSLINRTGSLERGDKRSNVLKGGTSHDLRRWV